MFCSVGPSRVTKAQSGPDIPQTRSVNARAMSATRMVRPCSRPTSKEAGKGVKDTECALSKKRYAAIDLAAKLRANFLESQDSN
jgi:hypothetical protein